MRGASPHAEVQLKRSRAAAPAPEGFAPNQAFFGWTLVSCERGDIRQSATGLYVYTEHGREERPLRLDRSTRDPVIEEFVDTIAGKRPALHDGRWARANLEVCVATIESGRTGHEVVLRHQVPVPAGS
jgi:phthalate 4,5-cis-dihydrodiol dehydrogenase